MEKAINVKTRKVDVMFGFINDENYGVDYHELTEKIGLLDLFPYINKGEVEITESYLSFVLFCACSELEGFDWENAKENRKYSLFMDVRTIKYEPTISVSFRIVKVA